MLKTPPFGVTLVVFVFPSLRVFAADLAALPALIAALLPRRVRPLRLDVAPGRDRAADSTHLVVAPNRDLSRSA